MLWNQPTTQRLTGYVGRHVAPRATVTDRQLVGAAVNCYVRHIADGRSDSDAARLAAMDAHDSILASVTP